MTEKTDAHADREKRCRVAEGARPAAAPRVLRKHGTERPFTSPLNNESAPAPFVAPAAGASRSSIRRPSTRAARAGRRSGADAGRGRNLERFQPLHDPHRSALRQVRRPSRPRLPRRAEADRRALLHERRGAQVRREERRSRRGGRSGSAERSSTSCGYGAERPLVGHAQPVHVGDALFSWRCRATSASPGRRRRRSRSRSADRRPTR